MRFRTTTTTPASGEIAGRLPNRPRALVLGHWSAVEGCAHGLISSHQAAGADIATYGTGGAGVRAPAGGGVIRLAADGPRRMRRLVRDLISLCSVRYDLVVVCQPGLDVSRVRGLLLALPHLLRARSVASTDPPLDPPTATPLLRPVTRARAALDLCSWLALWIGAKLVGELVSTALWRLSAAPSGIRELPDFRQGRVLYLRTDLDLTVTPLRAGGSLAHTVGIIGALRRRGLDVELWSTGPIKGVAPEVRSRRLPGMMLANLPVELSEFLAGLAQFVWGARQRYRPDLVYQRYSLNNLSGLLLARLWRVPLVLEANGSEVQWRQEWSSLRLSRLCRACERLLIRRADRICVVSENAMGHLLDAGGDPARMQILPNAVDLARFTDVTPTRPPAPDGAVVIAFSGLFYRWHGVQTLAEAFVRLAERRPEAHLLLIGDGEERATVVEKLRAADVLDRTTITGLVSPSAVPGYLAASDILVSPHANLQRFIGSPIKIFEYMASGRAIIASDLAQLGELLDHERTALLVPPGDADALATTIERLIDDPALRGRLGAAARREAETEHSWDARLVTLLQPGPTAGHRVDGNAVGTAVRSRGASTPHWDVNTMPVQT